MEKTPEEFEDYSSRYDLTFLTPSGHEVRFKVRFMNICCFVSCKKQTKGNIQSKLFI